MFVRALIAVGIGAGALLLLRGNPRTRGGLEGLGAQRKGIKGSPFFVTCTFDDDVFQSNMEFFADSMEDDETRLRFSRIAASSCEWGCVDDSEVRAAQFRNRNNPEEFAILAKSAKPQGGWQMNWFDARGPRGDSPRKTQCEAIKTLSSGFRYEGETVWKDGKVMSDWYLEEWQ